MFGMDEESGVNMDLENQYLTSRHSIAEHSDNEELMRDMHDVFCWVTGAWRSVSQWSIVTPLLV
jgi:hypothetical protein